MSHHDRPSPWDSDHENTGSSHRKTTSSSQPRESKFIGQVSETEKNKLSTKTSRSVDAVKKESDSHHSKHIPNHDDQKKAPASKITGPLVKRDVVSSKSTSTRPVLKADYKKAPESKQNKLVLKESSAKKSTASGPTKPMPRLDKTASSSSSGHQLTRPMPLVDKNRNPSAPAPTKRMPKVDKEVSKSKPVPTQQMPPADRKKYEQESTKPMPPADYKMIPKTPTLPMPPADRRTQHPSSDSSERFSKLMKNSRAPSHCPSKTRTPKDQKRALKQLNYDKLSKEEQEEQLEWLKVEMQKYASVCPWKFGWNRIKGGFRCSGPYHVVTDEQIAKGKGGCYM